MTVDEVRQYNPKQPGWSNSLLNNVLLMELVGVAEVTNDVAETVEDAVDAPEAPAAVPLADETDVDLGVEVSSAAVEDAVAEPIVVVTAVLVPSCRGIGRATPAKTTFRHKSRARSGHSRWDMAAVLILELLTVTSFVCPSSQEFRNRIMGE